MSFFWHVLNEDDYYEARLPFIASGEGVELLPYLDTASPAIPTVGIGFNMRDDVLQDPIIRSIFYPGEQRETVLEADKTYVTQIIDTIAQSHASNAALRGSLDAIMEDRRQYWEDAIALDPNIVIDSGVDEIYLYNHHFNANYNIDIIEFSDGFVASLAAHESWTWGTSGADTLTGTSGADTIIGKDGNDDLNGGNGADNIHGGSGDDIIRGGDSSDLLHGGVGDDIIYGDAGADTIFGGDGADTFRFEAATAYSGIDIIKDFRVSQGDVIDLADVLDGIYDPMSDDISDFVQFSQSGSDTVVSIDRDGTGATYGWTQIATLQGVVHADVEALATAGRLLVA